MTVTASTPLISGSADDANPSPKAALGLDANALILADVLTDTTTAWRIHNCKVSKKSVTKDVPMPFLYYYDKLGDSIKAAHPLTPVQLAQFDTLMSPDEAADLIGIDAALIEVPWHVKVSGSLVVFSEALQLAVRLHWTNTGKSAQPIYTKEDNEALMAAMTDWQFFGRVDVLYKHDRQPLVSICEQTVTDTVIEKSDEQMAAAEPIITLAAMPEYQRLPAAHALTVIAKLEADKASLPWFEAAIKDRLG